MKAFLDDDFLLESDVARDLYRRFAAPQPILDYHCHLPPRADRRRPPLRDALRDLAGGRSLQVAGDARQRRAPSAYCTGDAVGLGEVRGLGAHGAAHAAQSALPLDPPGAEAALRGPTSCSPPGHGAGDLRRLQRRADAARVLRRRGCCASSTCASSAPPTIRATISSPTSATPSAPTPSRKLYPTWRPERRWRCATAAWNGWVDALGAAAGVSIGDLRGLRDALETRHERVPRASAAAPPTTGSSGCRRRRGRSGAGRDLRQGARRQGARPRRGRAVPVGDAAQLRRDGSRPRLGAAVPPRRPARHQHARLPGAGRRLRARRDRRLPPGRPLARFLDRLDEHEQAGEDDPLQPEPRRQRAHRHHVGNFQDGSVAGKMQFGSAWWFLDQHDGMEAQLDALSNMGLFSRFVGMVTDSRSFLSFSRHEYFRRLLCNLLGRRRRARGACPTTASWWAGWSPTSATATRAATSISRRTARGLVEPCAAT